MTHIKTAAFALTLLALTGGAALAQTSAMMKSDGAMKTDSMAAKPMAMSPADTKMMKSCKAMSAEKMAKSAACMKMAKAHPDMMKGGAMMKSDGAMSSGGMAKH